MTKTIGNRHYDSLNAELVCDFDNGRPVGDPFYFWEGLFRDRSGEYFLHGRGGCASKYAKHLGSDFWLAGAEILPVTEDQVLLWLDVTGNEDVLSREFGLVSI